MPVDDLADLKAYLGDSYDHARLVQYDQAVEHELHEIGDEQRLYRESEAYLYNLTAFAMTGTKEPYRDELRRALPPPARILDYGCGIGSDGLRLIEEGYEVAFADFDNPSTRYLRWRLEQRGLHAEIYDLDREPPPADAFDAVYAFDVIEHVDDPYAFMGALERCATRLVVVNLLDPEPGETALHRELPVRGLITRAARMRSLRHRLLHGRSHLLLYEPRPAGTAGRLANRLRLLRG